jgi:Chromosome segregation ATPases
MFHYYFICLIFKWQPFIDSIIKETMVLPTYDDIMEMKANKCKNEIKNLEAQLFPLTTKISELEETISQLRTENKAQRIQNRELEEEKKQYRRQINQLQRALENREKKIALLKSFFFNNTSNRNKILAEIYERQENLKWLEKRKRKRQGKHPRTLKKRLSEWGRATSILGGEKVDELIELWLQVRY